jgi:Uncharacterized protein conserved in bacteria
VCLKRLTPAARASRRTGSSDADETLRTQLSRQAVRRRTASAGFPGDAAIVVGRVEGHVARDVEAILNTRIALTEHELAALPECQRSVLTYGLNDFAGLSLASHYDRTFICKSIQQAIRTA